MRQRRDRAVYLHQTRGREVPMRLLNSLLVMSIGTLAAAAALAQDHGEHAHAPSLGSVNFRNSGNAAAQEPFQRGVAWLHNFKYSEATDAFRDAQRADPSLAMAYWLEAFTYSHVLWGTEN